MSRTYKDRKTKVIKEKRYHDSHKIELYDEFDNLLNRKYPNKITWYWSVVDKTITIHYTDYIYNKYREVFDKMKPYLLYNGKAMKEPRSLKAYAMYSKNNTISTVPIDDIYNIPQNIVLQGDNEVLVTYYKNENNLYKSKVYTLEGVGKIIPCKYKLPSITDEPITMKQKKQKELDKKELYADYLHDKFLNTL